MIKSRYREFAIILIISQMACTRVEIIEGLNEAPKIVINGIEGDYYLDSIKVSLKNSQVAYEMVLQMQDANSNIESVEYVLRDGEGILYQDGVEVDGSTLNLNLENSTIKLSYEPVEHGNHRMEFIVKDTFGEERRFTFVLVAFGNLPPIAMFDIRESESSVDPLERIIDASGSYDGDGRFGGETVAFEYAFLGKVIVVEESSISIIFPEEGDYEVKVRVMDNDGEWSEVVVERVLVE